MTSLHCDAEAAAAVGAPAEGKDAEAAPSEEGTRASAAAAPLRRSYYEFSCTVAAPRSAFEGALHPQDLPENSARYGDPWHSSTGTPQVIVRSCRHGGVTLGVVYVANPEARPPGRPLCSRSVGSGLFLNPTLGSGGSASTGDASGDTAGTTQSTSNILLVELCPVVRLRASNAIFGDPIPGKIKILLVEACGDNDNGDGDGENDGGEKKTAGDLVRGTAGEALPIHRSDPTRHPPREVLSAREGGSIEFPAHPGHGRIRRAWYGDPGAEWSDDFGQDVTDQCRSIVEGAVRGDGEKEGGGTTLRFEASQSLNVPHGAAR
jgi:hypothetical protein